MVSIIIPVYNQQKHIRQCIESCISQSFNDIEIIIVDDCSSDNSRNIINQFVAKDPRIRYFSNQQNEGVEKTRYDALFKANGEYVIFVDSDDWLCNRDIIKICVEIANKTNVDYVEFASNHVLDNFGLIKKVSTSKISGLINQPDLHNNYYLSFFGKSLLNTYMWGKLYRKSTLLKADISPMGLNMCEDHAFNLRLFPHLKSIFIIPDIGYNYRWGGMTTKYNPYFYTNLVELYRFRRKFLTIYPHPEATDYLKIELKNVFLSQIEMMILHRTKSKSDILEWISEQLESDLFSDILQFDNSGFKRLLNEPDLTAIRNSDADTLLGIGLSRAGKNRLKLRLKQFISILFN
ncbi:MAG: glycosyltransferase [Duncaniella sp.]|nr:glycosyltransferase [Duncaniella sp.]